MSNLLSICTSKEAADAATAEAQCLAKERKDAHDAALVHATQADREAIVDKRVGYASTTTAYTQDACE